MLYPSCRAADTGLGFKSIQGAELRLNSAASCRVAERFMFDSGSACFSVYFLIGSAGRAVEPRRMSR